MIRRRETAREILTPQDAAVAGASLPDGTASTGITQSRAGLRYSLRI